MPRPPAGPAPVAPSAVVRRDGGSALVEKFAEFTTAIREPERVRQLRAMLGDDDAVERFIAVASHAISTNSQLLHRATVPSLIQAVKDSATLGLEPTGLTGEAWILVYGDVATLIPGWRGYVKRMYNSGRVALVTTRVVNVKDQFDFQAGVPVFHKPFIVGEDGSTDPGDYYGAYAEIRFTNGTYDNEWMSTPQIEFVRNTFSRAKDGDAWVKSWSEMARKTVLRRGSKRWPQAGTDLLLALDARADDLAAAIAADGATYDGSKGRAAALAAVAGRGRIPQRPPEDVPPPEPEDVPPPDDAPPPDPDDVV